MIDTVILIVPENKYHIAKPELFSPNANKLMEYGFIATPFKNNFKTADKYFPRLTITPRSRGKWLGVVRDLKIEFSVPKLIYQNNLKELTIFDDIIVYTILKNRLIEMGVILFSTPAHFEVSGFDIGKNITLSKNYFSFQIIKELSKCAIDRRLDLDNKQYQEGSGTTLQYYSNSHSFVIYDKVADLRKAPKRATDKDRNDLQTDLFDVYANTEIIRFEVRLRKKVKMKAILAKIGYKADRLTLEDLFNEKIWKMVLDLYWKSLIADKNKFLFSMVNDDNVLIDRINKLFLNSTETSQRKVFTLLGLYHSGKQLGLDSLRKIYEKNLHGKNWSKFSKDFEILNQITDIQDCFGWFGEIDKLLRFDN